VIGCFAACLSTSVAMGNVLDCASPIELPDDFGDETTECHLAATRLSRSMLWTLNRAFYTQHGTAAWASGAVPSFMSTNAYIAKAYSRYVLGTVLDVWREGNIGNMDEPLYIVEVGGGSGRLSYLILEALLRFERFLPVGPDGRLQIRYVVTDASQAIVDTWKSHPLLKTMCDEAAGLGLLDYGVFNAEKDSEVSIAVRQLPHLGINVVHRSSYKSAASVLLPVSKATLSFLLGTTWQIRCATTLFACHPPAGYKWRRSS